MPRGYHGQRGGRHHPALSISTFLLLLSWIIPSLSLPQLPPQQATDIGPGGPGSPSSVVLSPAAASADSSSAANVGPNSPNSTPDRHVIGPSTPSNSDSQASIEISSASSTPVASATTSQPTSTQTRASSKPPTMPSKDPDDPSVPKSSTLYYYFLLLALLLGLLVLAYWLIHRRKKAKNARSRRNSQSALARDLERDRRRTYGGWWSVIGLGHRDTMAIAAASEHREEGLNERGEAPPPYVESVERPRPVFLRRNTSCESSRGYATVGENDAGTQQRRKIGARDSNPALGLSIPMRTLSVSMVDAGQPPGYDEFSRRGSDPESSLYHSVLRNEFRRDSTRGLLMPSYRGSIASESTAHDSPEAGTATRLG
ncbi:MAG: hypothetical protein M1812_006964 [Candelaria pacifica]|nr:MAG: hypothetical protein M1812_006964 [Candelaria pacifica]